jgi:hypothetical protein
VNIAETARILAKAQLVDNRQITELVIKEWHEVIGHLFYEDAYKAVTEHRRTSTDYLQPAHVVAGARRAREARERESKRSLALPGGNQITLPPKRVWDAMVRAAIEDHRTTRPEGTP